MHSKLFQSVALLALASAAHCAPQLNFSPFGDADVAEESGALHARAVPISTTAQCGASIGLTCKGSDFGDCCSSHGWCGSSAAYCGTGCQTDFGSCIDTAPPAASTPVVSVAATRVASVVPSSTPAAGPKAVSADARCGPNNGGATCLNSVFGNCCSSHGWCGFSKAHCNTDAGCQPSSGTCGPPVCGRQGRPASPASSLLRASSSLGAMDCLQQCVDDPAKECKYIAFMRTERDRYCNLYRKTVAEDGGITSNRSGWVTWEPACFEYLKEE